MKKRKFIGMTNIEYFTKHCFPKGQYYKNCPYNYGLDDFYKANGVPCESINDCGKCWELPAIVNDRWILKEVK